MKPYPPLGILYICSHLRDKGFDVEVFDSTFSSKENLFQVLRQGPPSLLGIYANLMTRSKVVEILQQAKLCGWQTIVGGPEPGAYPDEYLDAGADIVVKGEGELTLEEILRARRADSEIALHAIDGIAFRAPDGKTVQTAPRALIRELDAQPWPARDAIDTQRYISTWRQHHGQGSISIITARGCPYHCRWCSHEVFGKTHRRRDPSSVADELSWLVDHYHPDMAWIADDVFTIHHGWLNRYAAELKKRSLRIPFECISRADRLNGQVADTLAEIGCFRVWIGSESGSQKILDAMERGVTVKQVQDAVAECKSRGIQTGIFLMWGYEGEEIDDVEATIQHVTKTNPDVFLTTVSYPIKGTQYFSEVSGRVEAPSPWQVSSDRELKIKGRHSRRFYDFADQLLKAEVELARLTMTPSRDAAALAGIQARIAESRTNLHVAASEIEV